MPRFTYRAAALTALFAVWMPYAAMAQAPGSIRQATHYESDAPSPIPHLPARHISQGTPAPALPGPAAVPAVPGAPAAPAPGLVPAVPPAGFAAAPIGHPAGHAVLPGYPYLNAPLSPTPVPNVPYQVGAAVITNQALSPHEMLYPHKYKALYPPFYHKVRGHWIVSPWGVWSYDNWELQGTEVRVNYRDRISPLSLFCPPGTKW